MSITKIGDIFTSNDHDTYVIHLWENFKYVIYKNSQTLNPLLLEEVPIEIQDSMRLDLGRLISNLEADLEIKKGFSK